MGVSIDIVSTDEASRLLQAAASMRGRMTKPLLQALYLGAQEVLGLAIKNNFTGKGPYPPDQHRLGVRTGRLRRSLRTTQPQVEASGDLTIKMGSNLPYFAVHEFGFSGTQHVRGHVRRNDGRPTYTRGKLSKKSTKALKARLSTRHFESKGAAATSYVKPHGRKVNIPARRPLGTAITSEEGRSLMRGRVRRTLLPLLFPGNASPT